MNFDSYFVFIFSNSIINISFVILEPYKVYHSYVDENEKPSIKLILSIVPRREKANLFLVITLQSLIGLLDLIGVFLVGFIVALTFSKNGSIDLPEWLTSFVSLEDKSTKLQILFLGVLAIVVLTSRTLLSGLITKRTLSYLSNRSAQLSLNLISKLLSGSILKIETQSRQSLLFSLTRGVDLIYINVIAALVVAASDISLLVILSVGLFLYNPIAALVILVFFISLAGGIYLYLHKRVHQIATESSKIAIESEELISEVFNAFRQVTISGKMGFFTEEIRRKRGLLASKMSTLYFSSYVSKYVLDLAVVFGMALIGITQFSNSDVDGAFQAIGIFLAAGTRILPAILRLQQSLVQAQSNLGLAKPTLDILLQHQKEKLLDIKVHEADFLHEGFNSELIAKEVFFKYPLSKSYALNGITLSVKPGMKVAVVGLSGSGKSTLVDLILGILAPESGKIQISGMTVAEALKKWPGAIAYVPQDVAIFARSIWDNITLGSTKTSISEMNFQDAIVAAGLEDFIKDNKINSATPLLQNGANLSGGERQRIGIARALFTKPKFLVLDEATSSLDGDNESHILNFVRNKSDGLTILMISHRLSTVRDADMIVYISGGKVIRAGSFNYVRDTTPEFDHQLKNMGL